MHDFGRTIHIEYYSSQQIANPVRKCAVIRFHRLPFIGWLRRFRTLSFDFGHQARFRTLSSLSRRSRLILKPSSDSTRLRPFSDAILHFLDALVQFHTLLSSFRRHLPISDAFIRFRISSVYNGSGVSIRI